MKKVLLGLVAILSMVFLVACGDKKTSEDAKVVRYNLEQNPAQLDPQLNTETVSGNVLGHIMEGLTSLGADGNPIPGVAESWTSEGNVWRFSGSRRLFSSMGKSIESSNSFRIFLYHVFN